MPSLILREPVPYVSWQDPLFTTRSPAYRDWLRRSSAYQQSDWQALMNALGPQLRQQAWWQTRTPADLFATQEFVRSPALAGFAQQMQQGLNTLLGQDARTAARAGGLLEQQLQSVAAQRPQIMAAYDQLAGAIRGAMAGTQQWASPESFQQRIAPFYQAYTQGLLGQVQPRREAAIADLIQQLNQAQQARESFASNQMRQIADQAAQIATANALRNVNIWGAAQGARGAGTSLATLAARAATEAALPFQSQWAQTMLNVLGGRGNVAGAAFDARRYGTEALAGTLADLYSRGAGIVDYTTRMAPGFYQSMLGYGAQLADLPRQRLLMDLGLTEQQLQAVGQQRDIQQDAYQRALQNIAAWAQLRGLGVEDVVYPRFPNYIGIPTYFV